MSSRCAPLVLWVICAGCSSAASSEPPAVAGASVSIEPPAPQAEPPAVLNDGSAAGEQDVVATPSGLKSKVLVRGTGTEHPTDADRVKVHYTGWTQDDKVFDSSVARGEPSTFGVTELIPGWTEALKLMVVGEKRRVWIPAQLAYGTSPRLGAPSGDLTFDIELLEIVESPKAPSDVAAPPASAQTTASGLAYTFLAKGNGRRRPKQTDRVVVHYSGWTTDGKLFDSSLTRGSPSTFSLNGMIPGWQEGLMLMVEGDQARFWIPAHLAYGNNPRPGAPSGILVFDIELLKIE
jgi:FKBP-type peptidyl-prolyl cis-trans isomerase